jgi:hypothetical protein
MKSGNACWPEPGFSSIQNLDAPYQNKKFDWRGACGYIAMQRRTVRDLLIQNRSGRTILLRPSSSSFGRKR